MVIDFAYVSCEMDQDANQRITNRIGWERILFQNNFGSGLSVLTNKHCAKFDIWYLGGVWRVWFKSMSLCTPVSGKDFFLNIEWYFLEIGWQ